jgi:purine-binding chemotaxis protein CheW
LLNTSVFGILVSLKDMAETSLDSLVVFGVGDLLCALPVSAVSEIVPAQHAARIPGALDGVEGLVNVRGRLLTVVDGRRMLGRESGTAGAEPSILLLHVHGRPLGLLVDQVHDLIHVPPGALEDGGTLPGVDPQVVSGVGRWESRLFVVLDPEVVLAPVFATVVKEI